MREPHPDADLLLAAALGDAPEDTADRVARHVTTCAPCHRAYAALLDGVDLTLPATPRAAPPPGFESRVLDRLRAERRPASPSRLARWVSLAAAVLVGVALGAAGVQVVGGEDPDVPRTAQAVPLVTADGDDVGAVSRTQDGTGRQLVVVVDEDGPTGVYTCRVVLADGTVRDVASWEVGRYGDSAWVLDEPDPGVRRIDLVSETGAAWASASL